MVLLIAAAKVSCGIFGMWPSDRSISLARTEFRMGYQGNASKRHAVDANQLVQSKVLDAMTIPSRLRQLLTRFLNQLRALTPTELQEIRMKKVARLESLIQQQLTI